MQTHLLFWQYKSKINKKGLAPLYLRITVDGRKTEYATGQSIEPEKWDSANGMVKARASEAQRINGALSVIHTKTLKIIDSFNLHDQTFTTEMIKAKLSGKDDTRKTLIQVFDFHMAKIQSLIGKDYKLATYNKFKSTKQNLQAFLQHDHKRNDIPLHELKLKFISDFEYYLKIKKSHSVNTIYKQLQRLQAITKIAEANDWIEKDPFRTYRKKKTKTEITFLTEEELAAIETKVFDIPRLDLIRDFFVFSCYTGLGYAEAASLTNENIQLGIDGEKWIITTREKTSRPVRVPLLPKALEIIQKYQDHPVAISKGTLLPVYANQKVNSYLKEIGDFCRINKNITHHMARRTFATTVTLLNDVPMETVSRLLGHSSIKITQDSYAEIVDKKVSQDFQKLKAKTSSQNQEPIVKQSVM